MGSEQNYQECVQQTNSQEDRKQEEKKQQGTQYEGLIFPILAQG